MTETHDIPYKFRFADVPYLNYTQFMSLMISISFMTIGIGTLILLYVPVTLLISKCCTVRVKTSKLGTLCTRMLKNAIVHWLLFCFALVPFTVLSMFTAFPFYVSIILNFVAMIIVLFHRHVKVAYSDEVSTPMHSEVVEREPLVISRPRIQSYGSSINIDEVDKVISDKSGPDSDLSSTMSEVPDKSMFKSCVDYVRYYPVDMVRGITRHYIVALMVVIFSACVSTFMVLPVCGTCFAVRPIVFSSTFSRMIDPKFGIQDKESICYKNTICHTYLTVPEDMSTSMIVNFHSYSGRPEEAYVMVREETEPSEQAVRFNATFFRMKRVPGQERYQYWADIINLRPNTSYIIDGPNVIVKGVLVPRKVDRVIKFRTGPSKDSEEEIKFVSGGDMEYSIAGKELSAFAASQNPLFALVGGDIAYENGSPACFMKADFWFYNWNKYMITESGHSIPILSSIGNHEAGGFRMKRTSVGFYLHYFPHELNLQNIDPVDRLLYHKHFFGKNMFIAITDSYIVTPIVGEQTQWLNSTLRALTEEHRHRIVAYHASAYPMVAHEIQDIVSQLKNHFCPLFEEHGVKFVLEHHYHALSQSMPMYAGKIDEEKGIHYLGSGAWGLTRKGLGPLLHYQKFQENYSNIYFTRCTATSCTVQTMIYHPVNKKVQLYSTLIV